MKILDTAERRQKEQVKKDLRKAINHTLDNVELDEAWKALGKSLQNAMDALGIGPGDDPHKVTNGEFADMLMFVTAAIAVREKKEHPKWLVDVDDSPLTPEDFKSVRAQVESWSVVGPSEVFLISKPVFIGGYSMGCSVKKQPCPFCDGEDKCDC